MNKILNQSQAEAVYSAMCALNNVGARTNICFPAIMTDDRIIVDEYVTGVIRILRGLGVSKGDCETFMTQAEFAAAYNLQG